MKAFFVLLIMVLLSSNNNAQVTTTRSVKITEKSTVKMDNGNVLPAEIWQALLQSGKYKLKAENPKDQNTVFILTARTEQEITARTNNMAKPGESKFFTTGEKIKNFKERDMNGVKYNLAELKGKVVVLNFWFVGCPPCRKEIPDLNEVQKSFAANKDVVFIAIALDEKYAIQEFIGTTPFTYNIIDNGSYIAQQYGVTSYPTHVIIDKEGIVRFHTTGLAPNTVPWVKKTIEELVKPQP